MLSRFCLARSMAAMSLVPKTALPVASFLPSNGRFMSTEAPADDVVLPSVEEPVEFRSVRTVKKEIRVSPRKLGLLAQQIRGLTAPQALVQMQFSPKRKSTVVKKTVQNAINLADIYYGIDPNSLKVEEAFVTKGMMLKRIKFMGRGNTGIKHRLYSHLTVVLREFDPAAEPISKTKARKLAYKAQKEQPAKEESS